MGQGVRGWWWRKREKHEALGESGRGLQKFLRGVGGGRKSLQVERDLRAGFVGSTGSGVVNGLRFEKGGGGDSRALSRSTARGFLSGE